MIQAETIPRNTSLPSTIQTSTFVGSPMSTIPQQQTTVSNRAATLSSPFGSGVLPVTANETELSSVPTPSTGRVIATKPNADVTLNMLNAPENEVDVEGLGATM